MDSFNLGVIKFIAIGIPFMFIGMSILMLVSSSSHKIAISNIRDKYGFIFNPVRIAYLFTYHLYSFEPSKFGISDILMYGPGALILQFLIWPKPKWFKRDNYARKLHKKYVEEWERIAQDKEDKKKGWDK